MITLEVASCALLPLSLPAAPNLYGDTIPALFAGTVSTALVLLGPGSFSIDSRLFGRREIIIPPSSRPPE